MDNGDTINSGIIIIYYATLTVLSCKKHIKSNELLYAWVASYVILTAPFN